MNPHSAAIAGSGNPFKSRFESKIRAKYFQNPPIRSPIHPLVNKQIAHEQKRDINALLIKTTSASSSQDAL